MESGLGLGQTVSDLVYLILMCGRSLSRRPFRALCVVELGLTPFLFSMDQIHDYLTVSHHM